MITSAHPLIWLAAVVLAGAIFWYLRHHSRTGESEALTLAQADDSAAPLERQAFFAAAKYLLSDSHSPCLLALIDIDPLQSLEHYAGLEAADNAVTLAAQQLSRHLPPGWQLGRTGDSRFALVATFTDMRLVKRQLSAVVTTIAAQPLCQDGKIIELDARCGYALTTVNPEFDSLYLNASRAVEEARAEGVFEPVFAAAHTQLTRVLSR